MDRPALLDQQLDAILRKGIFRNREEALREGLQALFAMRPQLRTESAIELFRAGEVSLLRGAEIAGVDFETFRTLLVSRGIPLEVEVESAADMDQAIESFLGGPKT